MIGWLNPHGYQGINELIRHLHSTSNHNTHERTPVYLPLLCRVMPPSLTTDNTEAEAAWALKHRKEKRLTTESLTLRKERKESYQWRSVTSELTLTYSSSVLSPSW